MFKPKTLELDKLNKSSEQLVNSFGVIVDDLNGDVFYKQSGIENDEDAYGAVLESLIKMFCK